MHELAITESIVSGLDERFTDTKVTRVVLEIGRLTAVVPESIRFCFDVCAEGTALEGAALEIHEIPARVRCQACAAVTVLGTPFPVCSCGSADVVVLTGQELRIRAVEVE